jgi:hypothetical protein
MSERRREHQRAKGIVAALAVAVLAAACSGPLTTREKGAIAGGAIGAGTGAIIGNQVGHTGTGALIGAGIGVVSGAVIGDAIQGAEQKAAQRPVTSPAAAPPPASVAVAPPPPVVAAPAPRMVWVPEWGMHVVEGHDIVYYNSAYYHFHAGRWWLSRSYAGPWAVVVTPPPGIAQLPPGHLHANRPGRGGSCPPGLAKQGRC